MLDVRRLAILREVHRCGTVTAAAAALHLTPSAVSQQLAALGRETRTQLVEPHGRRIRLTGAGLVLLEHAEMVLAELERAEAVVGSFASGDAGVARVGAFPTAITAVVVPAMARLREERPGLQVQVTDLTGDAAIDALLHGDLDIALWIAHAGSSGADARGAVIDSLLEDVMDVALPADHPCAGGAAVSLGDLRGEAWIAGAPASPCRRITEAACAASGFAPRVQHCTDDWTAVVGLVGAGAGVALVPRLGQPAAPPNVAIRPTAEHPVRRSVQVLTRQAGAVAPHIAAVIDVLHRVTREVAADRAA